MAHSSIIQKAKNTLIKELISDQEFLKAINPPDNDILPEEVLGKYLFDYHQNPLTITEAQTFVTVQVHIPESRYPDKTFVKPIVEIWIYSHYTKMKVDNVPKIKCNRNDYISQILDKKINGRSDLGIGKVVLKSNIEGTFQADYLYRVMTFELKDINQSQCDVDD
jgi:hypothetical protein